MSLVENVLPELASSQGLPVRRPETWSSPLPLEVAQIEFVTLAEPHPQAIGRPFGPRRQRQIVRKNLTSTRELRASDLVGPGATLVIVPEDSDLGMTTLQQLQEWLDADQSPTAASRAQLLVLQGAQILWHPHCVVVMASAARLATATQAALEGYFYESELRGLEDQLELNWEATLADGPLGFEFQSADIPRRNELATRFQAVLQLRARYAQLTSHIVVPHVYPPTLASQIGERLRERLRMEERLELLNGKLEVQERVYELCGHRTAEFMVARTGHHLEWAIIILLAFQTLMWIADLLSSTSP